MILSKLHWGTMQGEVSEFSYTTGPWLFLEWV